MHYIAQPNVAHALERALLALVPTPPREARNVHMIVGQGYALRPY